jgi:hypothetical protein
MKMQRLLGWIVLTNNRTDGTVKWETDWDGELHTDRAKAHEELDACLAQGHHSTLAEVRQIVPAVNPADLLDADAQEEARS